MFNRLETILRLICVKCYRCIFSGLGDAIDLSRVPATRYEQLSAKIKRVNFCSHEDCKLEQPEIKAHVADQCILLNSQHILTPAQAHFLFSNVTQAEQDFMGLLCNLRGLVIINLLVLPTAARPMLYTETVVCDDDLTIQYLDIVKINCELHAAIEAGAVDKVKTLFANIKFKIAVMFNNSSTAARYNVNMRPFKSIYERITGKEGQFRKHAMSKRADKTARTVISPNPYLAIHELQIPREIASALTIPQYVCQFNIEEVRRQFAAGELRVLQKHNTKFQVDANKYRLCRDGRIELGDIFWRALADGDWVLFNRQPTLHAPSMQAMQIKVASPRTFSFNLANCSAFNADMDGDEMNIHVPQTIEAITEMQLLSAPHNWLISDAHGGLNFGLVQDALLAAYLMSGDERPITRGMWCQLAMSASDCFAPPPQTPTPRAFVSVLLPADLAWSTKNIVIRDGCIVSGRLTKAEVGYNSRGLLLHIARRYGTPRAITLLTQLQFVGVTWLTYRGYSIGLADCLAPLDLAPTKAAARARYDRTRSDKSQLCENIRDEIGFVVRQKISPTNHIINLIEAGSKGNWINLIQINGIVGQQYVNGECVVADSLSHTAEARGFVTSSYLEGLSPLEFWGHLIAAREAICKTATGTAVTGYLQRKLIKNCENHIVQYDQTIRGGKKILHFPQVC